MKPFLRPLIPVILLIVSCTPKIDQPLSVEKNWSYNAIANILTLEDQNILPDNVLNLEFDYYFDNYQRYNTNFILKDSQQLKREIEALENRVNYDALNHNDSLELKRLYSELEVYRVQSFKNDIYNELLESLNVNGKSFQGKIVGYHKLTGKKNLEFDNRDDEKNFIAKPCTTWNAEGVMKIDTFMKMPKVRKPVIYLYPEKKKDVHVSLNIKNGHLTTTYPKYPKNGWNVSADPDGNLTDCTSGKEYYALYWEALSSYRYKISEGFSVSAEETADFLDDKLAEIGLNRREANEFIMYWLPVLEENAYNLIHFSTDEYASENELIISPKPDNVLRLMMVFTPMDRPIHIKEQNFKKFERKGFTVVEWGGMEQHQEFN